MWLFHDVGYAFANGYEGWFSKCFLLHFDHHRAYCRYGPFKYGIGMCNSCFFLSCCSAAFAIRFGRNSFSKYFLTLADRGKCELTIRDYVSNSQWFVAPHFSNWRFNIVALCNHIQENVGNEAMLIVQSNFFFYEEKQVHFFFRFISNTWDALI